MSEPVQTNTAIRHVLIGTILFLAAAGLIAACGGGGGTGGGVTSTRGVITGFGSVFVDGHEFTTGAGTHRRRLDDGMGDVSGRDNEVYHVGMVVTVHHDGDNTSEIEYENDVEGPIAGLNAALKTFTVLGQPVVYDNTTNFEPSGMTPSNGLLIEVSGLVDATGVLHATFIETKPGITTFEIKGYISGLDNTHKTFRLGLIPGAAAATITVDYSTAGLSDLPGGMPANGIFVEVKTAATGLIGGVLPATHVEGRMDIGHDEDRR